MREQYVPSSEPAPVVPPESGPAPEAPLDPRVQAALSTLEAGIDRILTSDGFADFLRLQSKFHTYSANNTLLIMVQRPEASRVAGYRKWQELNRQVKKGEKAIKIFVPHTYRDRDDLDDQGRPREKISGFGIGNVFDLSQTDGEPLPEPPGAKQLEGESRQGERLYSAMAGLMAIEGVTIKRLPGKANGYYKPASKEIAVNFRLQGDQAAKTLTHEAAHHVAGHRGYMPLEDAETVAEGSAFVVLNHFGIDSSEYTFPYVAGWAADRKVLQRNLAAIQKTSHFLIEGAARLMPKEENAGETLHDFYDRPLSADELRPNRGLGRPRN